MVGEDKAEGEEEIPMLESNAPTVIRWTTLLMSVTPSMGIHPSPSRDKPIKIKKVATNPNLRAI